MGRKRYTPEQIISILRQIEVELSKNKGLSTEGASRKACISVQTFYRWRKQYGGMQVKQAKRLKALEKENSRLKGLLADQVLDNSILREAAWGN
jgi:putative transposase